jgi:hypothetical protein
MPPGGIRTDPSHAVRRSAENGGVGEAAKRGMKMSKTFPRRGAVSP